MKSCPNSSDNALLASSLSPSIKYPIFCQKKYNNSYKIILATILLFIAINLLVGLIWIACNLSHIPQYGDTPEYLFLSKQLRVDQYRGIFYPYFIHFCNSLPYCNNFKTHTIIYSIQIVLTFFSSSFLAYSFLVFSKKNNYSYQTKLLPLIIGFLVSLDPLLAHFSLTILTDSLANSFTMLFLGCLILILKNRRRIIHIIIAAICFIIISLTRVDKFYFSLGMFLWFLFFLIIKNKKHNHPYKNTATFFIFIIFISMAGINSIKNKTQIYNNNRPPLDRTCLAFNRIVWPRMSKVYDYLPENIKKNITKTEAIKFDEHNNNVYPFLVNQLAENNGKETINTITWITLKQFPLAILSKLIFDFTKYSLPNLAYPLELLGLFPMSVATDWTFSRMAMFQPLLTRIFTSISTLSFFMMLIYNLLKNISKPAWCPLTTLETLFVISSAILTNSILFTLEAGMDAHIRYAQSYPT